MEGVYDKERERRERRKKIEKAKEKRRVAAERAKQEKKAAAKRKAEEVRRKESGGFTPYSLTSSALVSSTSTSSAFTPPALFSGGATEAPAPTRPVPPTVVMQRQGRLL